MNYSMPSRPLMLRTSTRSAAEKFHDRMAFFARKLTAVELSRVIEASVSTARRRQSGRGWTVGETLRLADALDITPSTFFDEVPQRREIA